MTRLFQYRFDEGSGLAGHSFGNLFIAAMSEVTGNFEEAVRETSRVLAVRGQILPSTLTNVTLSAVTDDDDEIHGESQIRYSVDQRSTGVRVDPTLTRHRSTPRRNRANQEP